MHALLSWDDDCVALAECVRFDADGFTVCLQVAAQI